MKVENQSKCTEKIKKMQKAEKHFRATTDTLRKVIENIKIAKRNRMLF